MLTIQVRGAARARVPAALRQTLRRQLSRAMRAAQVDADELCLSLSDDAELRALNAQYAGEDHATDVLSFTQPAGPAGVSRHLGDVIISIETAERQARAAGHELGHELLHLAVHGLCHLLGYDHQTPAEERVMFGYEAVLRAQSRGAGRVHALHRPPV